MCLRCVIGIFNEALMKCGAKIISGPNFPGVKRKKVNSFFLMESDFFLMSFDEKRKEEKTKPQTFEWMAGM